MSLGAMLIWILLVTLVTHARSSLKSDEFWQRHEVLDDAGDYHLYWTVKDDSITFKVEVATKGWIGFGLSPDGDLPRSDIFMGWVKGDKVYYSDYYAKNTLTILPDKSQDWEDVSGAENKTHTILLFSRKLDTCDDDDRPITTDTQPMIFTYDNLDPESLDDIPYKQTLWDHSRFKLLRPKWSKAKMPEDVSYFDIRHGNVSIDGNQQTYYYCRLFKVPLKKKHHVIKVSPVIRPQMFRHIHHICINQCLPKNLSQSMLAKAYEGGQCDDPANELLFSRCDTFVFCYGYGGGQFLFPTHVGYPVGTNPDVYWRMVIHYNNPTYRKGMSDDSGLRFYYTPHLRQFDSGFIKVGMPVRSPNLTPLPPAQKEFITGGHGSAECLAQGLPKRGSNVFAVFLHSHELTRKMKLRHFRGNKELPHIATDYHYYSGHQEYLFFEKDVTILPGDHLITECSVDTRGRLVTTFNGNNSIEEMCDAFLFSYPPIDISIADSISSLELSAGLTGMDLNQENCLPPDLRKKRKSYDVTTEEVTAEEAKYNCLRHHLIDFDWPQEDMCVFQKTLRYSPQSTNCMTINQTFLKVPRSSYPRIQKPYREQSRCKNKEERSFMLLREREMISSCAEN